MYFDNRPGVLHIVDLIGASRFGLMGLFCILAPVFVNAFGVKNTLIAGISSMPLTPRTL